MIISIDEGKASDKIQPFHEKTLDKPSIERMYFNITQTIYEKPITNIIFNNEKLEDFLLNQASISILHTSIQYITGKSKPEQLSKRNRNNNKKEIRIVLSRHRKTFNLSVISFATKTCC